MDPVCPGGCVLGIVGNVILDGDPEAERVIAGVFDAHKPRHFVSGGAKGIDKMAEAEADRRGMRYSKTIYYPEAKGWYYYKKRDQLIADDIECLVRIYTDRARTYGSGWTADQAEKRGARVWRIKVGGAMEPKPTTGVPGPMVPDRTGTPDPLMTRTREVPEQHNHPHADTVQGLSRPEVEAHAPGRSTDGATNNP